MNQTEWNPHVSQFIRVEFLLLKMVAGWNLIFFFFKSTGFTSSSLPIQPDFSQNQQAAFTLNTGSPRTLEGRQGRLSRFTHEARTSQVPSHFDYLQILFSLFNMTQKIVLSRCRLLISMTNVINFSYYWGNTKTWVLRWALKYMQRV